MGWGGGDSPPTSGDVVEPDYPSFGNDDGMAGNLRIEGASVGVRDLFTSQGED